jgi:hypothetical protein
MPWEGGPAQQVTKTGGASAFPDPAGQWIYYRSNQPGNLRRIRPDGSGDAVAMNQPIDPLQYIATRSGVYFVASSQQKSVLRRLCKNGEVEDVLELPFTPGLGLSVSQDERYVLLTKPDENGTDLMLVEGFR